MAWYPGMTWYHVMTRCHFMTRYHVTRWYHVRKWYRAMTWYDVTTRHKIILLHDNHIVSLYKIASCLVRRFPRMLWENARRDTKPPGSIQPRAIRWKIRVVWNIWNLCMSHELRPATWPISNASMLRNKILAAAMLTIAFGRYRDARPVPLARRSLSTTMLNSNDYFCRGGDFRAHYRELGRWRSSFELRQPHLDTSSDQESARQ